MKWSGEEWQAHLTDRYHRWCLVPLQVAALIRTSIMWLEFNGLCPQKAVRWSLLILSLKWVLTLKSVNCRSLSDHSETDCFFCTLLDEKNVKNGIPFQHKRDALNSLFYQPKVEKLLLGATSLCKPLYRLNGKLFKSWLSSPRNGLGSDFKKNKTKLSKTNTTCGKLLNSKLLKLLVLVTPISYCQSKPFWIKTWKWIKIYITGSFQRQMG